MTRSIQRRSSSGKGEGLRGDSNGSTWVLDFTFAAMPFLLPTLGRALTLPTLFQNYRMKMLLRALPFWRRTCQNLPGGFGAVGEE